MPSHKPDPAAEFAAAKSLETAVCAHPKHDAFIDIHEGHDGIMRSAMLVGRTFEAWCCQHLDFDKLEEPWPYFLEEWFGPAFIEIWGGAQPLDEVGGWERKVAETLRLPLLPTPRTA